MQDKKWAARIIFQCVLVESDSLIGVEVTDCSSQRTTRGLGASGLPERVGTSGLQV
jgi:hypothetical protein